MHLLFTPEGNIWLYSCKKLHTVHKLVANFLCLLCRAGQVTYSIIASSVKSMPSANGKKSLTRAIWVNKTDKVQGQKTKQMSWKMLKRPVELRRTVVLGDNFLSSHYNEGPVSYYTQSSDPLLTYTSINWCTFKNSTAIKWNWIDLDNEGTQSQFKGQGFFWDTHTAIPILIDATSHWNTKT